MGKVKKFIEVIKKINRLLTHNQRKESIWVFVWMMISSICEMLGVSVIVPFISVLLDPESILQNQIFGKVLRMFGIEAKGHLLLFFGLLIILIFLIKNIALIISTYVQSKFQCKVQEDLSLLMLNSYMKRDYEYFVQTNSMNIMRGVIDDAENVFYIIQVLFSFLAEVITISLLVLYCLVTDWQLAIGVSLIALLCVSIITVLFKNAMKREGERYREINLEKNKDVMQLAQGIKDVFVLDRKNYFVEKFKSHYDIFRDTRTKSAVLEASPSRITETFFISALVICICIRVLNGAVITTFVSTLSAFAVAVIRMLPSVNRISSSLNRIVYLKPALDAAYENVTAVASYKREEQKQTHQTYKFENELVATNISWKYQTAEEAILKCVNLTIHKGDSIGLIGESGAGKTTLGDIILGLFTPQKGTICVDGNNIYENKTWWKKTISYVPQVVFLLDGSIRENIVFGLDDDSDEKIWKALEEAQLKTYVESLPDGLDTQIGEQGIMLSGGQRQRMAIARALYTNPEILLLDEATAALDNETEAAVMGAIEHLQGKKTLIIIAHRLSTIQNCDFIYEVKDGSIEDVTEKYRKRD